MNRFSLLDMGNEDNDSSEEDDENNTSDVTLPSILRVSRTSIATWKFVDE